MDKNWTISAMNGIYIAIDRAHSLHIEPDPQSTHANERRSTIELYKPHSPINDLIILPSPSPSVTFLTAGLLCLTHN